MSYECENIHQLKLINFNSSCKNVSEKKSSKICENSYAVNSKDNSKPGRYISAGKNVEFEKVQSKVRISRTQRRSSRAITRVRHIFRKSPFNPLQIRNKRSVSLNDIKQKLSAYSVVLSDRLKWTVQSIKSKTSKKQRRKTLHEPLHSVDKGGLQVLFRPERNKETFRNRKFCKNCKRLDLFYDSKSSGDVFELNRYNPQFAYQLFNCPNRNLLQTPKFEHNLNCRDDECFREHQIKGGKNCMSGSCGYTVPVRYNLVDASCRNNQSFDGQSTISEICVHEANTIDVCPCISAQVSVTPSCFPTQRENVRGCDIVPVPESKNEENIKRSKCVKLTRPNYSLLTSDLSKNPGALAKSTLKYILFGIAIIVWSPCIILVGLYWLLTYPLRPQHVFSDDKQIPSYKCGSCFECRHNFLHFVFHGVVRIANKVFYSYNALYCLLKKQKHESSQSLNPCLSRTLSKRQSSFKKHIYPNPKIKYTLCYTRKRRWTMRPISKGKGIQCECHQNFQDTGVKKRDKECECRIEALLNKSSRRKLTTVKSIIKRKKPRSKYLTTPLQKVFTKTSPNKINVEERTTQNPSVKQISVPTKSPTLIQKPLPETPSHEKKGRNSTSNRELSRKTRSNLPPNVRTLKKEINEVITEKPTQSISFRGNTPKYVDKHKPCNKQITSSPLHTCGSLQSKFPISMHRSPMKSSIKVKRDRIPCPCAYKNVSQKYNRTIVCVKKNIPRKVHCKKIESKGKHMARKRILCSWCKCFPKKYGHIIKDAEKQSWKYNKCDDMFVNTLRRKPCFWIYNYFPSFYPYFLIFYKFYENVIYAMMFIITTCIWFPIICWCYFCYTMFCRCIC